MGFPPVVQSEGYFLVAVSGLLIAVTSLVVGCRLSSRSSRLLDHRLNSCGTQA